MTLVCINDPCIYILQACSFSLSSFVMTFSYVVKKGKFVVETSYGDISVLGTSFNIKSRKNDFTVFCFTGKVQVKALNKVFTLTKGEGVRLNKNKEPVLFNDETLKTPNWMNKESVFYEVPYQEVKIKGESFWSKSKKGFLFGWNLLEGLVLAFVHSWSIIVIIIVGILLYRNRKRA